MNQHPFRSGFFTETLSTRDPAIFDAIRAHDAEGAARQMLGHMQQTQDDIAERVGGSAFR